jgi:tetratricopeptide (TPR) repeat protein
MIDANIKMPRSEWQRVRLDPRWERMAEQAILELETAANLMREGLPRTASTLGLCLTVTGHLLNRCGRRRQALVTYKEAVSALQADAMPNDRLWAQTKMEASWFLGRLLFMSERLEEAAAALQEADHAQRDARIQPRDGGPLVWLSMVYVAMKQYQRAIDCGIEAERLIGDTPSATPTMPEYAALLYPTLATAFEELKDWERCGKYHNAAMALKGVVGGFGVSHMSCFARSAMVNWGRGELAKAETYLDGMVRCYRHMLETEGLGLAKVDALFKPALPILKQLLEIKLDLGKEEEARALNHDLEETETIFAALKASALDELRSEIHTAGEEEQGAAAEAARVEREKERKKLKRKQKRKAARRRKAEAVVAAEAAAAAGGAGGGVGGGGTADGRDGHAEGQAAVEEPEPEPEPKPEPEPEPEECAICLNDLEEGMEARLLCTHVFHTQCLERWKNRCLEKELPYTCGMCRRQVVVAAGAEV